ncbi:uracil-DNA glycosylase [Waterburya agarophytonicola K14]|uniref:Uracil-DNA glycosylase n=1 Tax=Waterburya agarophytonicola KI4 TaxID=2874699 RepID=A0A964BUM3_9CYAN|nr:uracil-DNA glycosylase family protein [Waterburya agarophytonicola]MCC0178987.1 uracil-DNA glycosylase [Waterburya agarophytonicola KI4]
MSDINTLIDRVQQEAQREEFPIDIPVYKSANLEPTKPILYAGNLESPLCFFGRDLGKDEVLARQPLIGASGTMVRKGFYYSIYQQKAPSRKDLDHTTIDRVLLSNTVPYKPPGNKAYLVKVKQRFRPFIEQLFIFHWQGNQVITLGTEAFKWFAPYGTKGELDSFFSQKDTRYEQTVTVSLTATDDSGMTQTKAIDLLPLPHPSPLNTQYYAAFPGMLQKRLAQVEF